MLLENAQVSGSRLQSAPVRIAETHRKVAAIHQVCAPGAREVNAPSHALAWNRGRFASPVLRRVQKSGTSFRWASADPARHMRIVVGRKKDNPNRLRQDKGLIVWL